MVSKYVAQRGKRVERLSSNEQAELLDDLVEAFAQLKNYNEAAAFMVDLMTGPEVRNFSKRLRIAKLLLEGKDYDSIRSLVKVSQTTIAKVSGWLGSQGGVIKKIIERLPKKKEFKHWTNFDDWDRFKRRYPSAFWPGLLLEDLEKSSQAAVKKRSKGILGRLAAKDSFDRELKEEFGTAVRNRR